MHLYCLNCKKNYSIPYWVMRIITYREYSYCNKCYKAKEGKSKSLIGRLFTIV
jgi:hypothetical protein